MALNRWTRKQDLAVLYAKLEYGRGFRTHPDIERLATAMGRTEDSIMMRMGNFDSLEPSAPSGGLGNAANLTKEIWNEYVRSTEQVFVEARGAYTELLNTG